MHKCFMETVKISPITLYFLCHFLTQISGIHNYAPQHLKLAVEFLSKTSTKYPYERLVGPLYKLSQFESAVQDALTGRYWRVGIMPGVE